ncbi:hypothetical protein LTR36_004424 [Oleoguttula mirabilis]|uniref:Uncharacterized protein n=1 Tax=Oleoguttula mirabilis TaxID=1507867 RepID=A0AAV9JI94_9PEZI|nr:hypothetical protein LTR36_004424 [Oleoguttula mirabilis]
MPPRSRAKGNLSAAKVGSSKRKTPENPPPLARTLAEGPEEGNTPSRAANWTDNARRSLTGSLADVRHQEAEPSAKRQRTSGATGVPYSDFALNMDLNILKNDASRTALGIRDMESKLEEADERNLRNETTVDGIEGTVDRIEQDVVAVKMAVDQVQDHVIVIIKEIIGEEFGLGQTLDEVKDLIEGESGLETVMAEVLDDVRETKEEVAEIKEFIDGECGLENVMREVKDDVRETKDDVAEIKDLVEGDDGLRQKVDELGSSFEEIKGTMSALHNKLDAILSRFGIDPPAY